MTWVSANLDLIVELSLTHARLSVLPIVIGFLVALPLGTFAWRFRWAKGVTLTVVGLLYTIPSLALFVLLPPIIGISFLSELNVTIALSIYAVALMSRSATEALDSVDPAVRGAATAMGYSGWGRYWAVDLPLAGPVLLAGLRVVSVSTVSLVTVGVLVGSRNLGYLFLNGLQRGIVAEIATGIVMTVVIAIVFDVLLSLAGRLLMPWTRGGAGTGRRTRRAARRVALTEGPT